MVTLCDVMATGDDQQFCLRWNNFPNNFASQFDALRHDEAFVDVTLTCEGRRIEAHKLVLSACSPYFKQLFKVYYFYRIFIKKIYFL